MPAALGKGYVMNGCTCSPIQFSLERYSVLACCLRIPQHCVSQSLPFLAPDVALAACPPPPLARSLNLGMELLGFETGLDDALDAPPLDTGRASLDMARSAYTPAAGNGTGLAGAASCQCASTPMRRVDLALCMVHLTDARFVQLGCISAMIRFLGCRFCKPPPDGCSVLAAVTV